MTMGWMWHAVLHLLTTGWSHFCLGILSTSNAMADVADWRGKVRVAWHMHGPVLVLVSSCFSPSLRQGVWRWTMWWRGAASSSICMPDHGQAYRHLLSCVLLHCFLGSCMVWELWFCSLDHPAGEKNKGDISCPLNPAKQSCYKSWGKRLF